MVVVRDMGTTLVVEMGIDKTLVVVKKLEKTNTE
jgi:hypothetical protein